MVTFKKPFRLLISGIVLFVLTCPANCERSSDNFENLMKTIHSGNSYQRIQAIQSLARLNHPKVVPVLINLLKDEDSLVRSSAALQLSQLSDKRSTDAVVAALGDDNEYVRRYAGQTLLKIGISEHVPALVESVIKNFPDQTKPERDRSVRVMLEAIGKLSRSAPAGIVNLLSGITSDKEIHRDMWWYYEAVGICLEQIGDKSAYSELKRVESILSNGKQDYKAWYAFRKALGATAPETDSFNRPAADFLYPIWLFKITQEGIRKRWILPLAELGEGAIEDLAWAIKFEGENDRDRKNIATQALGEIGGEKAAKVLREYIHSIYLGSTASGVDMMIVPPRSAIPGTDIPTPPTPTMGGIERLRGRDSYSFRLALLALLKAQPNRENAKEVIDLMPVLDMGQRYLLHDIDKVSEQKIPMDFKISFYKKILMEPPQEKHWRGSEFTAANLLKDTGSKEAGEVLSEALLRSENDIARHAAAKALGSIQRYDSLPILMKAAREQKTSVSALAEAMGRINNPKALIALEDMEGRAELSEMDRLWLAAALARLGKDYEKNAEFLRNSLPASYEPMSFLNDAETINILINKIQSGPIHGQAISTLDAIGSREALVALGKLLEQDNIPNPQKFREVAATAARMAERLEVDSLNYYSYIATVSKAVLDWFEIHQRVQPRPKDRSSFKVVERHSALARKLWTAEATRRLDLAVQKDKESYEFNIPEQAIMAIAPLYSSELIPILKRIAKESQSTVEYYGKDKIVKFYHVRSKAAEILTEKMGRRYSFIDADGRRRPGGWHPSQEQ